MLSEFRHPGYLAGVLLCGSSLVVGAQKPQVADILKTAADYLVQYSQKLTTVAADEDYVQREPALNLNKRIQSDLVLVGLEDGMVSSFRDAYAVDGHAARPQDDRMLKLLQKPSAQGLEQAQGIGEEARRSYVSPNLGALDSPTMALEFLRGVHQGQSEFSLDSIRNQDGAQIAIVKFKAQPTSTLLPVPDGAATAGRFWIDTATGTVRQTEITVSSKALSFRQTTKYAHDPAVSLWVPTEMLQLFELSSAGTGGFSNMGAGGGMGSKQSLEGRARYSKYRRAGS